MLWGFWGMRQHTGLGHLDKCACRSKNWNESEGQGGPGVINRNEEAIPSLGCASALAETGSWLSRLKNRVYGRERRLWENHGCLGNSGCTMLGRCRVEMGAFLCYCACPSWGISGLTTRKLLIGTKSKNTGGLVRPLWRLLQYPSLEMIRS